MINVQMMTLHFMARFKNLEDLSMLQDANNISRINGSMVSLVFITSPELCDGLNVMSMATDNTSYTNM